jgi:probable O-glycosylation ligase (exosortase A-associated)
MPIRDLVIVIAIVSSLPLCFLRPWIGILVWSWVAYMNPHRLAWDFAYDTPVALMVGIATLAGFVLTRDRTPFVWTRESIAILALWGWFSLTSIFAIYPESAWAKWREVSKILLMALLAIPLFQDRARLRVLLLVIAGSIGFYGVKGGVFALASGGQWMVLGPPGSFFEANTELALVLNMCLPILLYLAREETRCWMKCSLWLAFALTALAVPFTYSRGGVVGLVVVLSLLFLRARARVALVPVTIAGLLVFAWFAPQHWLDRMETLREYDQDESANLRLMSWQVGWQIAADRPLTGGGFRVFVHRETYDKYMPEYPRSFGHDAHSIYFNLMGEHGWIGLGLFALLVFSTFGTLRRLRAEGRGHPNLRWIADYSQMLQASIVAYLVTGTFLSVAYFDLAYQLFIIVVILKAILRRELATSTPVPVTALPHCHTSLTLGLR